MQYPFKRPDENEVQYLFRWHRWASSVREQHTDADTGETEKVADCTDPCYNGSGTPTP